MEPLKWLVISYSLPSEPSRLRVSAWRSLKKAGAVNVQQSMWILPYSNENTSAIAAISEDIEKNGGQSLIAHSEFPRTEDEKRVISYFNVARDEEYKELIEKCKDFFEEIKKEGERKNYTFAEIEENEEELGKLHSWYGKIKTRDIFGSELEEKAAEKLKKSRILLEEFSDKVYETNIKQD